MGTSYGVEMSPVRVVVISIATEDLVTWLHGFFILMVPVMKRYDKVN